MSVSIALLAGLVLGFVAVRSLSSTLQNPSLSRINHRGRALPTAGGLALVLAVIVAEAVAGVVEAGGWEIDASGATGRRLVVLAALGFGLLGFVDDLLGVGESGGFKGHLAALARGRLTSGGVKLVGGAALSLVVMAAIQPGSVGRILADGALVALAANLANLFDRAPGRTTKVALLAFGGLLLASGATPELSGVALVVGAAAGLLWDDLRENLMLGDVGANVLGAVLGIGVVLTATPTARNVVLVLVAALNVLSEVVSFSRVIDRTPPLRALDRLGRPPIEPPSPG